MKVNFSIAFNLNGFSNQFVYTWIEKKNHGDIVNVDIFYGS